MIGYDRVSTSADLSPPPNRVPKAAMDSPSYGAHAHMLGARLGVRTAEDGHLTLLRAHAAVAHVGCDVATHQMRANATGDCRDRALRGDRALIIYRTVL